MKELKNFINGEFVSSASGKTFGPNIRRARHAMAITNAAWREGKAFSAPSAWAMNRIATLPPMSAGRGPWVGKNRKTAKLVTPMSNSEFA